MSPRSLSQKHKEKMAEGRRAAVIRERQAKAQRIAEIQKYVLDQSEAAEFLGTPEGTLRTWRHTGDGPVFVKKGKRVGYRQKDLEEWLEENAVYPKRRNGK